MIHLSPTAIRELQRLQSRRSHPRNSVRLIVTEGGCAGLIYDLVLEPTPQPQDQVFPFGSLSLRVTPETLKYCDGLAIEYSEDLMGGNFRFTNPLAQHTCSCGVSFSLEPPTAVREDCATPTA